MKKTTTLLFFTILALGLSAQIGINVGQRFNDAIDWQIEGNGVSRTALLGDGFSVGIDYWIPMKTYRVDFMPEVNYTQLEDITVVGPGSTFKQQWMSLFINTNFYLFDLEGDCDCPTFSKSGNFFSKGFFIQASPGISYLDQSIEFGDTTYESEVFAPSLGVGIGLDLGISDLITITPLVTYRYFFQADWEGLNTLIDELPVGFEITSSESTIRQFHAGVRLGLRF
jgi:hypothetical protein